MKGCKLTTEAHARAQELPLGESIVAFFETRRPTGDFLQNLLANDLIGAFSHADDTNARMMHDYVRFLYNHVPGRGCGIWGSHENVSAWVRGETEWEHDVEMGA